MKQANPGYSFNHQFRFAAGIRRVIILFAAILIFFPELNAQRRGGPVPVPQGGEGIFPDWVFYLIFGGIALFIAFSFLGWLGSRFRDFKSFTELLSLLFWVGGLWLFRKETHWGFWWCLLAGFASAIILVALIEYLHKKMVKRG